MKLKMITTASLTTALLLGVSSVSASNSEGYINAQLGIPDVSGFSGGIAVIATYGMPMSKLIKKASNELQIEGEFTTTLLAEPSSGSLDASYYTFAGYAVYTHAAAPKFDIRARAGLLYESVEIDTGFGTVSDTDIGISFGFGGVYKLRGNMDVIAEYTVIESDIAHLSAGVQMKF